MLAHARPECHRRPGRLAAVRGPPIMRPMPHPFARIRWLRRAAIPVALALLFAGPPAAAVDMPSRMAAAGPAHGREPVLEQIRLPHSYYYREMYLPQATSGPSSADWSPDGRDLVLAMQGSLWIHRLDSKETRQVTNGPGYDAEPDWSPDGRFVVYTSYRDDAVDLFTLQAATCETRPLLHNGAVNVDPRFSPDGRRVAFVSTEHEGRFHIEMMPFENGKGGEPERLTDDHDSGLPRYYYSVLDHYISPAWSPDGKEILFVSN